MKATKQESDYSLSTNSKERCGNCEHFQGNACSRVEGVIKPQYWCKFWEAMKSKD